MKTRDGGLVLFALLLLEAGCAEPSFLSDGGLMNPLPGQSAEKGLPPRQAMQALLAVADQLDKNGDAEGAIDQYERVLAIDTNNLHSLRRLAILYDCVGKGDRSEGLYQKLAKATPRDATVLNDWGRHYYLANGFREAENKYRMALQLDPNLTLARCNLALALGQQERYPEAFETFRQAGLKEGDAHCNMGFIFFTQGKMDLARQECVTARQLDPTCRKAEDLLARIDATDRPAPAPQAVYRSSDGKLWAPVHPQ
jgi:Tfp pilus assembly protein PilF